MIANVNNNRCGCSVVSINQCPPTTPPNSKCCLVLCNLLAKKEGFPCNDTKTIDLTSYIKIPTCCNNLPVTYSIPFHTDNLTNVSIAHINDTYILSYTSNYSEGKNYKSAEITYQFSCNQLINQATIIIPFKQINPLYNCSYKYDPCTGNCIEEPGDITIVDDPSSQISIT
jgi:hypothetical protein